MTAYCISYEIDKYPILQETDLELSIQATQGDVLDLHGNSVADRWSPLQVEWLYDDQPESNGLPDIALWRAGQYACSEAALPIIKSVAGQSCEFLPLIVGEQTWYAIHVLKTLNAIDPNKTTFNFRSDGRPNRIRRFKKLVLMAGVLADCGLCHVNGAGIHTYCTQEFFFAIQSNELKGLLFSERETS